MLKTTVAVVILVSVASSAGAQVNSADLKWGPAPAVFPKGAQMAVLSGDPGKAGEFVIRLKMPAGYNIPAHHHPTDEYVTVVSGDLGLGMGDKLDPAKSAALEPKFRDSLITRTRPSVCCSACSTAKEWSREPSSTKTNSKRSARFLSASRWKWDNSSGRLVAL